MRPSRRIGGAAAAHSPLGTMNRAGSLALAGGERTLTSDRLIQSHSSLCRGRSTRADVALTSGNGGHVRGIDVIRVRDGKISAKLSYVKG